MPDSFLSALRSATRARHDALEGSGFSEGLTDGSLSAEGYARVVRWQDRAHALAEPGLAEFDWPANYGYQLRRPSLASECLPTSTSTDEPLAPPSSLAEAAGRAYVLEGSALGGNVILGHLRANPRLSAFRPFPFYSFQREVGLAQWRAFTAFAKTRDWSSGEIDVAIREARRTFDAFARAQQVGVDNLPPA